jgi:PfaB family protein
MQYKNPVAVIGISGIFPEAANPKIFWKNIIERVYAGREIPDERWIVEPDSIFSSEYTPDKAISKKACLITDFQFDPAGIDLDPELLKNLDPLYHLVLQSGRELLSGMKTFKRDRTGVILAAIALPTDATSLITRKILGKSFENKLFGDIAADTLDSISAHEAVNAGVTSLPGAILAEAFGLGGGTMTLDAACASSIYAVKLACDKLNAHRTDMMIAGGVSRPESLYTQIGFSQLKALSPSGICAPFDEFADGLVVGEGVGMLALKRLDDALADNDTIYGIIRGTGLSNDIRGNLLAPDVEGQVRAMTAAYKSAGWTPYDVDLIECHGAGTPVGDNTELLSLRELWGASGWSKGALCAIGSVKSNIGHLLTGAGAAGMIKTLLALKNGIIPPSCNFKRAAPQSPLNNSPFQVPAEPQEWRRRAGDIPRRAAVSAFGFGGINGHILFEEWRSDHPPSDASSIKAHQVKNNLKPEIAIIGMDVSFGSLPSLREFQEAIFRGDYVIQKSPSNRWHGSEEIVEKYLGCKMPYGAFAEELSLLIGEFRIPPREIPDILIQQLLMLKVADGAIKNAGISIKNENPRAGAIIGIGFDFETTDFTVRWNLVNAVSEWEKNRGLQCNDEETWLAELKHEAGPPLTATRTLGSLGSVVASRIAREFRFGGPSFSVSGEETSGLKAIRIGMQALQNHEIDLALAGAVDLCGDVRSIITFSKSRKLSASREIHPFDKKADGTLPGEGAAAIIMKRLDQAIADGDRIYAVIKGAGTASGGGINSSSLSQTAYIASLRRAFKDADLKSSSISLFEAHGSGDPDEDRIEAEAAEKFFAGSGLQQCALGSLKPNIGHTGAAAGLASVVKASLCLFQEIIPPLRNFKIPACQSIADGAWHIPIQPQYWLRNRAEGPRRACVGALTNDGNVAHLILEAYENNADPDNLSQSNIKIDMERKRPLGFEDYGLFIIEGDSREELLNGLTVLKTFITQPSLNTIPAGRAAAQWYLKRGHNPKKRLGLSISAKDIRELEIYIRDAEKAVLTDTLTRTGIKGGVAYAPEPLGPDAETAFVFPGSGNHYLGMGRDLGTRWPEILRGMDQKTGHLKTQLIPERFVPWRASWPENRNGDCSKENWEEKALQEIESNPLNMIFGQVVHGGVVSNLVRSFGVNPDAAIGYSLGESAGFFALEAWPDRGEMLKRMEQTRLFTTELAGSCHAARKAWNIPGKGDLDWHVAVVNRPAGPVREVLADLPETRLLIINTPNQCVIGGIRKYVEAAIKRLGCESVALKGVVTVHCDAAEPVAEAYRALHLFPVNPDNKIKFYSCASGQVNNLTTESAADSILNQALRGFDFNKTINQAYQDGIRIFLEMGPHASCTGMISSILGDKPHLAVSACSRFETDHRTIIKLLGALVAERVAFSPDLLYGEFSYPPVLVKTEKAGREIKLLIGKKAPKPHLPETETRPRKIAAKIEPVEKHAKSLSPFAGLADLMARTVNATAGAHQTFLKFADFNTGVYAETFTLQNRLLEKIIAAGELPSSVIEPPEREIAFSREMCLEFAAGSVAAVLGPEFAIVDTFKARVRLPDEPLMLVDRIISIQGEKGSMGSGRIITEHDILPGAWYLDGGRAPVCISVEAGQADLFLCSYLGIDLKVKGTRTYRLLDATVKFHSGLPLAGDVLRYEIEIEKFIRQDATYMFFFNFKGTANGRPLITMTNGCAGFFTEEEVKNSGGIILTNEDPESTQGQAKLKPQLWEILAPAAPEAYDDAAVEELRQGNPSGCFGELFENKNIPSSLRLPEGRMSLINRVQTLDPNGGRSGLGLIRAETDIHPDDWFLTCHFVDDMVMPGTLMYECCAHTLRIFVQRMGWIHDKTDTCYEPVIGIESVLKCRGPVTPQTKHVIYEVEIKEAGYTPEPYVIADAYMYADGQMIVIFRNMSLRMSGVTEQDLEKFWSTEKKLPILKLKTGLFSKKKLLAFATGLPSEAFGEKYRPFDNQRFIARLPAPPFLLIDRITRIEAEPWRLKAGGWIEAEYDISGTAWYFKANRSRVLPFSFLLEIALQPCGWLAAYMGSALKSRHDLKFRNLDGNAVLHRNLYCHPGTLTVRTKLRQVSEAGDMIIEQFDFQVFQGGEIVYEGDTTFGFFTEKALAMQTGLPDAGNKIFDNYNPDQPGIIKDFVLADHEPFTPGACDSYRINPSSSLAMPAKALKMIDKIDLYLPEGGPNGLGFIRASKQVDPDEWYFKAHFLHDPVIPGSLGIESFLQLLKFTALKRWNHLIDTHQFEIVTSAKHTWTYRGQILPKNRCIEVEAAITGIDEEPVPAIYANGFLKIDGLYIYKINGLGIKLMPSNISF